MLTRLRGLLDRDLLLTLVAQGLNFVAMLLPALLDRLDLLAPLVTVSALASITSFTATLSFASVHLGLTDQRERTVSLRTSLIGNVAGGGVLALAAFAAIPVSPLWSRLLAIAAVFAVTQGFYIIATTTVLARSDHAAFARARIAYAVVNITLTAAVALLVQWSLALALVAPFIYLFAALTVWRRGSLARTDRPARAEMSDYVRRYWPATIANFIGGLGAQVNALATSFFGPYSEVWAGVVRISGGFSTISHQVVAPVFDMRMSQAVRQGTQRDRRRVSLIALIMGAVLGAATAVGVVATLLVGGGTEKPEFLAVLPIAVAYALGVLVPTVAGKFLVVLGHQKLQMIWVILKLVASGAALLAVRGFTLLASLAMIEVVFSILYVVLLVAVRGRIARHRPQAAVENDDPQARAGSHPEITTHTTRAEGEP